VYCLVDGDNAGAGYVETLATLENPPNSIFRWPAGWAIEDVICWIVAADPAILNSAELQGAGLPVQHAQLRAALSGALKSNEIVHTMLADALVNSDACLTRSAHILRLLADVAGGRDIPANLAASTSHQNGVTRIWIFNDAAPGI
jgi:hypothetical protein